MALGGNGVVARQSGTPREGTASGGGRGGAPGSCTLSGGAAPGGNVGAGGGGACAWDASGKEAASSPAINMIRIPAERHAGGMVPLHCLRVNVSQCGGAFTASVGEPTRHSGGTEPGVTIGGDVEAADGSGGGRAPTPGLGWVKTAGGGAVGAGGVKFGAVGGGVGATVIGGDCAAAVAPYSIKPPSAASIPRK